MTTDDHRPEQSRRARVGPRGVHRGFGWELSRAVVAVAGSTVMGILFGALCGFGLGYQDDAMGAAAASGGFIGFAMSPLFMCVTMSRAGDIGALVVTLVTSGAAVVLGLLAGPYDEPGWATLGTVAVYAIACVWWRLWSGSGAWTPLASLCRRCGYDLHGLDDRPCPECGAARELPEAGRASP